MALAQTQKQELKKKSSTEEEEEEIEELSKAKASSSSTTATTIVVPCLDDGKMEMGKMMIIGKKWRWKKRERKKKRERVGENEELFSSSSSSSEEVGEKKKMVENGRDPLEVFGSDMMMMILHHLDARSVALSLLVSRGWHGVASSDRLWSSKCEELWLGKAHIPRMSQVRGLSKLDAYSISLMDGKRTRIMKDDLCDHVWEFHFNKGAPEYWRNLDPYWKGTGPPMRRYFHPDGSQSADGVDKVWGGHECSYSIVTSYIGDGRIREHYVRINRWPRMHVFRKLDWSWEMINQLYSYSSIPDADKEGGTGPVYPLF